MKIKSPNQERRQEMKRRRTRKKQVYGGYYEKLMEPIYMRRYQEYLKRVKSLKKKVISLGDIPQRKTQLIKTLNYFVEIVNLATNFVDKGMLIRCPIEKEKELREFESAINTITCRNSETSLVQNKTPKGGTVTYDTLYIGVMHEAKEESNQALKTQIINGKLYNIEVDFASINDWVNGKVRAVNGKRVELKQEDLAKLVEQVIDILLDTIDSVLK